MQSTLLSEQMANCPSSEYNLNSGLTPYGSLATKILLLTTSIKQNANTPSRDRATLSAPLHVYKCIIASTSHLVTYSK